MDDDLPEDVVHRLLAEAMFPDHPLGRETARDDRTTVETITPDDVRIVLPSVVSTRPPWWWPSPARSTTSRSWPRSNGGSRSSGPVEPPGAGVAPGRAARRWSSTGVAPSRSTSRSGSGACLASDADREALDVVNHVLGGGPSSRLFDEIREQRGLAYAVGSGTSSYADAGIAHDLRRDRRPPRCAEVLELDRRPSWPRWWRTASPPTSWRWPSATSPGRTSWVSRTTAAGWPASARCSPPPGPSAPSRSSSARWRPSPRPT